MTSTILLPVASLALGYRLTSLLPGQLSPPANREMSLEI
jgi:hypothetical protein